MAESTKTEPLAARSCVPCQGGVPPLSAEEQRPLLDELDPAWSVENDKQLRRDFRFENFSEALEFVNEAGAIAEKEDHHPELTVGWGHCLVAIWTHKIDGLTHSDFVLAAKYDQLVAESS